MFAAWIFNSPILPVTGAAVGALMGFLLFNSHPARLFMGDTGSLALGGFVAAVALMLQMPLFLLVVGIIYVSETMSVIIQVGYFKLTGGKRFFKMAPIHHSFELAGWPETKIVAFFYVVTAMACLLGYLALMGV
jgi:phospho-N-acetylmuramoyl-pentapeptide-transferase